jgi:hypothetical protein
MIEIRQNDTRPKASTYLTKGGASVNLSGASGVTFRMREQSSSTLKVEASATILNPTEGYVEYTWVTGDTDTPGVYYVEWEVLWADGGIETFPTVPTDVAVIYGELG